jgi:hypothetical protein
MTLIANRWMFVPVLLLGCSVTIGAMTVLSAVVGHPLGMEPNYDRKAANWESERTQRALNERLNWVVTPELHSNGVHRSISLRIEDKYAARVEASLVQVECIPVRDAERRQVIELPRRDSGIFAGEFDSPLGGQWEFRLTVERDGLKYTDAFRRFLTPVVAEATHG